MDKFLDKISEYLFGALRPVQLTIVVFLAATVFLVTPSRWLSSAGIDAQVDQYKFFLWLVSVSSAVLLLVWSAHRVGSFVRRAIVEFQKRRRIKELKITYGGRILLFLLDAKQPDSVRMHSAHPDVLELRRHNLIKQSPTLVLSGDYDFYYLTSGGRFYLSIMELPSEMNLSDSAIVTFIQEVTGENWRPDVFRRL